MKQCNPRSMVENNQNTETTKQKHIFHSNLGFGESLGQYKASEALVSFFHCVIIKNVYIYIYAHISTCMYILY